MRIFMKRTVQVSATLLLASFFLANSAFGAITNVTRLGASANCAPTVGGTLVEGSQAYCDRTEPTYTYTNVPQVLLDLEADYVIVAVEDRTLNDYGLEVTVDFPGSMLLFIQDDLDVVNNMPWVAADGYTDTGFDLTVDKTGSGFENVNMNIYSVDVTAGDVQLGPITTGAQVEGGGSIYGVAFVTDMADLEASGVLPDSILAGTQITATASVSNAGPNDATGVLMRVTFPAGLTYVSDNGGCSLIGGTEYECDLGDLGAGGSGSVDFVLDVALDAADSTLVVATLSDMMDPILENNSADVAVTITQAADLVTSFDTSISFTNGDTDSVMATLTCNTGLPLEQSFEISEGSPVNFVVTDLPFTTPGTSCEITINGVDAAYSVEGVANTEDPADSCLFEAGTFDESGANTCVFTATPNPTSILVNTSFVGVDDPNIDTSFETTLTCTNVSPDTGSSFITAEVSSGVSPITADWYAAPELTASCTVVMVPESSAVEGGQCAFTFVLGDAEAGCDVVGTVFFEGIPTLSQYGMAIMALLMLGVGMVGFRRFV